MIDYIKVKRTWKLLLFFIIVASFALEGAEPPLLIPKNRSKSAIAEDSFDRLLLDVLILTPLGKEDFYEKRFSSFGGGVLFSVPITRLASNIGFYGSLGLVMTVSRLTLNQGENSFSSIYLQFPLLAKAVIQITPKLNLDAFLGTVLRTTRIDSRSTTDGGWQKVAGSDFFQPEVGLGLKYAVSSTLGIKLNMSYLFLGIGVGFDF